MKEVVESVCLPYKREGIIGQLLSTRVVTRNIRLLAFSQGTFCLYRKEGEKICLFYF